MAKRRRIKSEIPGRWRIALQTGAAALRPHLIPAATALLLAVAALFGLQHLEGWVAKLPQECPPVRIEWAGLPDWLCLPENRHILDELTTTTGITEDDRLIEPNLAAAVAQRLSDPAAGWIRQVDRVVKRSPDTLVIRCEFRRPIAWVRHDNCDYLVDVEGVRLPGRYKRESLDGSGLPDVVGVKSSPPPVGQRWPGSDLHAGLAVLDRMKSQPFRHQVTGVSVENYMSSQRRDAAKVEVLTDHHGARVLWGHAPGEEQAAEISADQKIALMNSIYEHHGRIDMNLAQVDITTWSDRIVTTADRQNETADAGNL